MRGRRMGRRGEIVCGEVEVGVCGMAWGAQWVVAVASGGGMVAVCVGRGRVDV